MLDDVRVYDRALSAGEIAELAAPPSLGPVAHWKLDETSGATAVDSVGGNDGTLNNGPVWTPGTIDGGLDFDGSNDYVITDSSFTPPPVGTVTFWMKVSGSPGSDDRILGLNDTWEIRHVTTGTPDGIPYGLVFDLGVSGVNTEFVTTTTIDTPGQWYHIAASYDTTTDAYAVYIDGVPHKSGTYPSSLSVPAANLLSIGTRTGASDYYDGMLDDVRVYDAVLTPAEIADLAAAGGGGGGGCSDTFRDEFKNRSYSGSDGTLSWSTDWLEIAESDGPTGGDEQVLNDESDYQLQVRDNNGGGEGVEREANLSGYTSATLNFEYRRQSLDNANDYVTAEVSNNGGSSWTEIDRFEGSGTDSSYQSVSYDITSQIASNTRIRFLSSSNLGNSDMVFFDNVEICVSN